MQQILGFDVLVSEETCVALKALFSIRYKHNDISTTTSIKVARTLKKKSITTNA